MCTDVQQIKSSFINSTTNPHVSMDVLKNFDPLIVTQKNVN